MSPASRTFLGSGSAPDDPRPSMVRTWVVAAVALVIGIAIGFASGFTAADRLKSAVVSSAVDTPADAATPGRPFSEAAVPPALSKPTGRVEGPAGPEPVRVEETPVVPEKEVAPPAKPLVEPAASPRPARRAPSTTPRAQPAPTERAARVEGPAPPAPAEGPGSMQIVSRPAGAQVILDGRNVGRTPLSLAEVPAGPHAVRLDLPGFKQWSTTVEVAPGQRLRVAASLEQ